MEQVASEPWQDSSMGDKAFEALKGYEQELLGLLDLFSRTDKDASDAANAELFVVDSEISELGDLKDLPVPDLMNEDTGSWTQFLLDEFPSAKLLSFPAHDSAYLPCDFLAIDLYQTIGASTMQPSLPPSMFPATVEASAQLMTDPTVPAAHGNAEKQHSSTIFRSLNSEDSSTSIAGVVGQEPDVTQRESSGQSEHSTHMEDTRHQRDTLNLATVEVHDTEALNQQEAPKSKRQAPKRKRANKGKDSNTLKRKAGRPRVHPNCIIGKHLQVFARDGEWAKTFESSTDAIALVTDQPIDNETASQITEPPQM